MAKSTCRGARVRHVLHVLYPHDVLEHHRMLPGGSNGSMSMSWTSNLGVGEQKVCSAGKGSGFQHGQNVSREDIPMLA